MSTFSVDGLSSGLDTTSIIEELMAVEAQPIVRLESRRDDLNSKVDAWNDLGSRITTLTGAIDTIVDGDGTNVLVGDASNPNVTVSPTGQGAVGSFEFTVDQIATTHQLMSDRFASPADAVGAGRATIAAGLSGVGIAAADIGGSETGHYSIEIVSVEGGTATIVFDGEEHEVSSTGTVELTNASGASISLTADGEFVQGTAIVSTMVTDAATTVGALVTQFSDAASAAAVQVVDTGDGSTSPFTVVATARTPGLDNTITIDISSPVLGAFVEIRSASNTVVTMGEDDLVIERSDVLVEGIVPGMVVDLSGADVGEELRVNVTRDADRVVENVRDVIDAANGLLSGMSTYGRSDPEAEQIGILSGEFSLRRLESVVRAGFTEVGVGKFAIGSQIGIETTQDGSLTFDEAKFSELLASDFGGLHSFLIGDGENGYLGRIQAAVETAAEADGVIENATTNLDENITAIDETIVRYERRLEIVEAGYRRQFTAMETLLAQLNSQSSFLASQLTGQA